MTQHGKGQLGVDPPTLRIEEAIECPAECIVVEIGGLTAGSEELLHIKRLIKFRDAIERHARAQDVDD
ncbi:hypothetical protein D3C86_1782050 [compost metagenome]